MAVLFLGLLNLTAPGDAGATNSVLYAAADGTGTCATIVDACSLSTALHDAVAGSEIELVTSGATAVYSGGFTIKTSDTTGAAPVTIRPAPGVAEPILDGGGSLQVLTVGSGVYLVMSGVTIENGHAAGKDPNGGGLSNNLGGVVSISRCRFRDNSASGDGGAIGNDHDRGNVTVTLSVFTDNVATGDGGAIGDGGSRGSGTLEVTSSTFSGNGAAEGGAIGNGIGFVSSGAATVDDSTFSHNHASLEGGAIDNGDGLGADSGGTGVLSVSDSTFTKNAASGDGGAIDNGDYTGAGTLELIHSTLSGNSAGANGAGIDNGDNNDGTSSSAVTVGGDLLANRCSQGTGGSETDQGYNAAIDTSCFNGGIDDVASASSSLVSPLTRNGGPTSTMALRSGNPAIRLIPNETSGFCPTVDQRGDPSPAGQSCDAGSVQLISPQSQS